MVLYNGNAEVVGNFRALNFYKASDVKLKEDIRLLGDSKETIPRFHFFLNFVFRERSAHYFNED
jgi:hypothetical protein